MRNIKSRSDLLERAIELELMEAPCGPFDLCPFFCLDNVPHVVM